MKNFDWNICILCSNHLELGSRSANGFIRTDCSTCGKFQITKPEIPDFHLPFSNEKKEQLRKMVKENKSGDYFLIDNNLMQKIQG